MLGRTEEVLVTGVGKEGQMLGRTRNFKEVWFEGKEEIGTLVKVKIGELDGWILKAERI